MSENISDPVARPPFIYDTEQIKNLILSKFWRESTDKQPQIKLHGSSDKVIKSQEDYDRHFRDVVKPNYQKWWRGLNDDEKISAAKAAVYEKIKPEFNLQIPDKILKEICEKNR